MIGNNVDAGWNCRDHAWLLNFLLQGFGFETLLAHGEVFFGARNGARHQSVSYTQNPHSWVFIKGLGSIDLSIKRRFITSGDQFEMPIDWIFLNNGPSLSRCTTVYCDNRENHQQAIKDFHEDKRPAVAAYLVDSLERLDVTHLDNGAAWMQSPLAFGLRERIGKDPSPLYGALLHHMTEFISDRAHSLTGHTFESAWDYLHSSANRNTGLTATIPLQTKAEQPRKF